MADPRPITVLVVDDEPPARAGLMRLLAGYPEYTVVGDCGDGTSAIQAIRTLTPDLVLLDVQMPPPNGLAVVRAVGPEQMPAVIFVTAHDRFAVAAFNAHAVDYVLKPYSERLLLEAMLRARDLIESRRLGELARRLIGVLGEEPGSPAAGAPREDRIVVRSVRKTEVVPVSELLRVEASGYCVRLITAGRSIVHREALGALEKRLGGRFIRVHRSTLVNVEQIREARVRTHGEHELVLRDGSRLKVSRQRWAEVNALLRKWGKGSAPTA
jgi:two-component system LytT family response regulator